MKSCAERRLWLGLYLLLGMLTPVLATEVQVLGLLRDMAIVRIDGKQHRLRVGESTPEGIKLIAADSNAAILEIGGQRQRFGLGSHTSISNMQKPVSRALIKAERGMMITHGYINGVSVKFLIDTGASYVAMNSRQAKRLGIDYRRLGTRDIAHTAGGNRPVYKLRLDSVQIGEIRLNNVEAGVVEGDAPAITLLGMSFLQHVKIQKQNNILVLTR
jgi:aspartyl protease family protein